MYFLSVEVGSFKLLPRSISNFKQEFVVDRANSQTIFNNQLVCAICIGFLNNIWFIPF